MTILYPGVPVKFTIMKRNCQASQLNEYSTTSTCGPDERGFFSEVRNGMEKLHVSSHLSRVVHHRPFIYIFTATLLAVTFLPLVVFVLVICGSFGLGIFIFVVLEGGLVATSMAVFLVSIIIPLAATVIATTFTYAVYKATQKLRGFLWQYFECLILIWRWFTQRLMDLIYPNDEDDARHTEKAAQNKPQDPNSFETTANTFRIEIVPVRRHRTRRPVQIEEEFQNLRHASWSEVEDKRRELGIVEGSLLYMANFLRTLVSLLMFIFVLQAMFTKIKENSN